MDCFHGMNYNYQGRHPLAQLAAMVAYQNLPAVNQFNHFPTTNYGVNSSSGFSAMNSTPWLADFSCNTHITANLFNLSMASEYSGDNLVSIGSG